MEPSIPPPPTLALLPWGDVFVDFLDRLGVTLEQFRDEFTGSWMFGYATALRAAGARVVIICPTVRVNTPLRLAHAPSDATLWLVPVPRTSRALAARALQERLGGRRNPRLVASAIAAHLAPYLATPLRATRRIVREEGCAAILCQEYETPRFDVCVALGRIQRLPVFATFQGGETQHSRLEAPVRPRSLRAARGIVVAPESEAERVRDRYGVDDGRIARIPNPVDATFWASSDKAAARRSLGLPPDARVVAWHGQVQLERKGLDVLLEAWQLVTDGAPAGEARLLLVGDGEDAERLRKTIEERRLRGVHFVQGWVHDRAELRTALSAADVYAFPSRREGFPVAPLEAMACSLPVVGSDATGMQDVVGETGLVVPRGDAGALAAALSRLLGDDELRLRLGHAARRRVEASFAPLPVGRRLRAFLLEDGLP
jgi:glycosyltransferase involved in cell wall biosynthesis